MLFHVPHHSDNEYSPFGTEVTPSADQKDGHHDIWREKKHISWPISVAVC
jgi:hypothetical protein